VEVLSRVWPRQEIFVGNQRGITRGEGAWAGSQGVLAPFIYFNALKEDK
jgi:hypothetical protein